MNKSFELLQELINSGKINVTDYYNISLSKYDLNLQAKFDSSLVGELKKSLGAKFIFDSSTNFVDSKVIDNGINIKITLT